MICKICDIEINSAPFHVVEMMFGIRSRHVYYECPVCEALQIETIPADMEIYYPENYYSFRGKPPADIHSTFSRRMQSGYLLYNKNKILGRLLSIGYKMPESFGWLKTAGVKYDDPILDIGSGSGEILAKYLKAGFTNLTGIDPFLKNEFVSSNGMLKLLRRSVFDRLDEENYDFVMLNHSFEHMDQPQRIFQRLSELVKPGKILLVRTPVNRSFASKKYKDHWVDMDPPRHFVVHSLKSMQLLAEKNNFELEKIVFDSTAFQFWGSEQYEKDIPLHDPRSYAVDKKNSLFTENQINEWKKQAEELNNTGEGDQACFYLRRK